MCLIQDAPERRCDKSFPNLRCHTGLYYAHGNILNGRGALICPPKVFERNNRVRPRRTKSRPLAHSKREEAIYKLRLLECHGHKRKDLCRWPRLAQTRCHSRHSAVHTPAYRPDAAFHNQSYGRTRTWRISMPSCNRCHNRPRWTAFQR